MRKLAVFPLLVLVACSDSKPAPTPAPGAGAPAAQPAPATPTQAAAGTGAPGAAAAGTGAPGAAAAGTGAPGAAAAGTGAPGTAAAGTGAQAEEPAADPARGEVELELTGALTGTLRGAGATCSRFEIDGAPSATIKVMSRDLGAEQDWDLTLMVTREEEWETPAVILNVRGATRASYTYAKKEPAGESVSVARDLTGAAIDLTLKELVGKRTVKVKGTIACPG